MNWEEVQFESIHKVPLKNGIYKTIDFQGRGEKIVNMKELFAFEFISNQEMRRIELDSREKESFLLDDGDLLFGRRSLIESGSGKCSIIINPMEETTFESSLIRVRLNKEITNPIFYYYYFKSEIGRGRVLSLSSGANVKGIRGSDLKRIYVPKPSKYIQDKVVSILLSYDELIENNLKRIKLLEEKAKLHYKELMLEIINTKSKREEIVKDCLEFYIGGGWGQEEYKEGYPEPAYVIRGTDIPNAKKGEINNVPFRYHKESNLTSRKLQAGDIVFEVSGGSKGQPVGRSILITEKMLNVFANPVMCASFCKMLKINEIVSPEFFYCYLLISYENGVISQYEKHSASNIVNYGFEEFITEQKIIIPKEKDLNKFTAMVKPIFTLISTLGAQNTKLREARDILLPKLMSGEIEELF